MEYLKQSLTGNKINHKSDTGTYMPGFFVSFLFFVYMFMSYYESFLSYTIGSVTKYLILFIMFILIFSYKKLEFRTFHFFMLVWLILKLVSSLWANDSGMITLKTHFVSQLGLVAFFIVMTLCRFDKKMIERLLFWCYIFSFSVGFLSLFLSEGYLGVEVRQTLHLFGATTDPNNQSAICLFGVTMGIYYFIKGSRYKILHISVVAINIISMFLTASRGGLLSLFVVVFIFVMVPVSMKPDFKEIFIKLFIIGVAISLFIAFAKQLLPEDIYNRLFDFSSYQGGSYRAEKWTEAFELIWKRPLFGNGWGGNNIFSHNTYITMLLDVGIVGLLLFFTVIGIIFGKAVKQKNLLPIILIISGFAPAFFIDAINKRFFWNAIVLAAVIVNSYVSHGDKDDLNMKVPDSQEQSRYIK